jgi:hypothetical protein
MSLSLSMPQNYALEYATVVHKFGRNPDIDGVEDLWEYGGTYSFMTAAAPLYISSDDDEDDQTIRVFGLDADWQEQIVVVDLVGQAKTLIPGSWIRVYRALNQSSTEVAGTVYIYEDDTIDAGVPDTPAKVKATIDPTSQQTLMAIYSVPAGHIAYIDEVWVSGARAGLATAVAADLSLRARSFGGVFLVKQNLGWHSYGGYVPRKMKIPLRVEPKSDILVRCDGVSASNLNVSAGFDLSLYKVIDE